MARSARRRSRDHAERRAAAAHRGPVRLRRRARRTSRDVAPRMRRGGRARSSAAAAGRRPSTSRRCGRRSTRSRDAAPAAAAPAARSPTGHRPATVERSPRRPPTTRRRRPRGLAAALAAGRFVISVEIDPPRSIRIERTIEAARLLQASRRRPRQRQRLGDGPRPDGRARRRVRDPARPRPRVPGPLHDPRPEPDGARVGAARRARAGRPQHPRADRRPAAGRRLPRRRPASGTWTPSGWSAILARLNRGEDGAGSPIGQPAGFTIACALDPTAADAATEWDRLERKLEAGAHLVMTQPLYSVDQVEAMLAEARRRFGPGGFPVPVLLGVLPLQTARHAEFLHNEVPGITIPDDDARGDARGRRARRGGRAWRWPMTLLEQVGGRSPGPTSCPASAATSRAPSWSAASARAWERRSRPEVRYAPGVVPDAVPSRDGEDHPVSPSRAPGVVARPRPADRALAGEPCSGSDRDVCRRPRTTTSEVHRRRCKRVARRGRCEAVGP